MSTSVVASQTNNACTDDELSNEHLAFKAYPIRSEVASISIVFDDEVFCDILDDQIALSTFSGAVGSTTANLYNPNCEIFPNMQDSYCEMLNASDKMINTFASATHA